MAKRLEILDEDEQYQVWNRLIEAVSKVDLFSATELDRRIGKPYAFSVKRKPHHRTVADVVQITSVEMWVGETEGQESDDFRLLKQLGPVLTEAVKSTEISEVVLIDWAQRLSLIVVDPDEPYGWEHSPETLKQIIRGLKKEWVFRPVPTTPAEVIDDFTLTPIEARLYRALKETSLRTGLMFTPQCWLVTQGRPMYRVDFMVHYGGQAVAVEVDGHESDKNKADRNRDSARDRFLVQRGIQTIRFTESQITADVGACVEELGLCLTGEKGRPPVT
jgi:very-short-patch-repair endonuclease